MKNQQEAGKYWPQEGDSDAAAMSGDALVLEQEAVSTAIIGEQCAQLADQVRAILQDGMASEVGSAKYVMLKELLLELMWNAGIFKLDLPPDFVTQVKPGVLLALLEESKQGQTDLLNQAKSDPESLKSIPRFGR